MSNSARLIIVYLTLTLLMGSALTFTTVTVTGEERADRDRGNLREIWNLGLGTGLGELEAIVVADVDNDGDDELIVGNGQGYLHIMEFDPNRGTDGGFVEEWQSVDMGGPVRALAVANIDDDDALEIAVGYNLDTKAGLVRVIDGITKSDEENWTAGVGFLVSAQAAEIKPYGLLMEDVDDDGEIEVILGGDQGYVWVMDAKNPEGEKGDGDFFVKAHYDEGEWTRDLSYETGVREENTFGVAVGYFDDDPAMEIMVPTKDGDVVIYDGEDHEAEYEIKAGTSKAPGWNPFGGLGADLDGDGNDEFILGSDNNLIVYKGGENPETTDPVKPDPAITEVRGFEAIDLYGNNDPELVVVTNGGMIYILSYDGDDLTIDQSWDSGEKFRGDGGGLAYLADGGDNGWLIHGGDMGVIRAWEVTSSSTHEQVWSTDPADPLTPTGGPYSLVGGYAYGNAIGDLDDDGVNEVVVGSYQGRALMFDGVTRELEWFSPILEGAVVGLEITDVNNDGEPDLLVGTGDPFSSDDEGSEVYGKLHIYYNWNVDDFDDHYQTPDDIESVWGIAVGEVDGTTYPEIALAVARSFTTGSGANQRTDWSGWMKVYGYDGSDFEEEYSTGDYDSLALGVAIGDADNDGSNEIVVGVANNSATMKGRIYTYDHTGSTYSRDLNLATDNPSPFGLEVVDLDDDGEVEIITGDAENPNAETYGRLTAYYYDGSSTTTKEFKNLGTSAAWGLWTGNLDQDVQLEAIAGKKNGALLVFEAEEDPEDSNKIMLTKEESESTSLSTEAGFYSGISVGNLSGDDRNEIVVGSSSYIWVFGLEGDLDKPDLEVHNTRIYFDPEEPTDEEDVKISVIVRNLGTGAIDEWRVTFYDGEPIARNQIAVYPHAGQDPGVLVPGGSMNISRLWYADPTLPPGDHNITVVAEDTQSPQKETRETNNQAWAPLYIEEIPNDAPVAVGSISKDSVWKNEAFTLYAGESHDTEDTGGDPDNEDGVSDLSYSYFPKSGESGWTTFLGKREYTFEFESSGIKQVKFQVRDSKKKVSEVLTFEVEVVTNTEPRSHLKTNATPDPYYANIYHDQYIILDASESNDPNNRTDLEYKFATDNTDGGEAWVSEWGENGDYVSFTRMGVTLKDDKGKTRQFLIDNGMLSFNYTLDEGETTRTFFPQVLVKEIPPPISQDEPLESDWTIAGNVSITVSRPPNHPPTVTAAVMKEADASTQTDGTLEVPLFEAVTFLVASKSDPDGDSLSFTWTIPDSPGSASTHTYAGSATDGSWGWSFDELGTYTIILTADDGNEGVTTDTVTVRVIEAGPDDDDDEWPVISGIADKLGLPEPVVLIIIALPILLGIAGAAVMHGRAGGEGEYDYSEAAASGVTMLTCPTCGSSIEVATPQRPVRVSCGGCASEFILRE